jgi:hypothetical protein
MMAIDYSLKGLSYDNCERKKDPESRSIKRRKKNHISSVVISMDIENTHS